MTFRTDDGDRNKFDHSLHHYTAKKFDHSIHYYPQKIIHPEQKYYETKRLECDSIYFNGTSSYIDCGSNASCQLDGALSFSTWVITDDSINKLLIGWAAGTTPGIFFRLAGINPILYLGGNNYRYFIGNSFIHDEKLHHIAVTLTGVGQNDISNSKYYIDAQELATGTTVKSGAVTAATKTIIGNAGIYYHKGFMKKTRIYKRVISENEVLSLYKNLPISTDNLVLDLPMTTEGSTDIVLKDLSGNDNDGTLTDCTWDCDHVREKHKVI